MLDRTRPGPHRYLRAGRRSSGRLQRLSSSGSAAGDVEPNYTSVEMPRVRPPLSSRSASGEQICTLDNTSILRPKIWAQFGHNLGTIWGAVMTNLERNLGAIWAPGARKLGVKPRKRATQFGQAGRARRPWAKAVALRCAALRWPQYQALVHMIPRRLDTVSTLDHVL